MLEQRNAMMYSRESFAKMNEVNSSLEHPLLRRESNPLQDRLDLRKNKNTDNPKIEIEGFKTVIFMRHGKVEFSFRKAGWFFFVHHILNCLRGVAQKFPFIIGTKFYKSLSRLVKLTKKKLTRFFDSNSSYDKLPYKQFMRLLLHEIDPPLLKSDSGIKKIPKEIDVIYHSTASRSIQTAKHIQRRCKEAGKIPRVDDSLMAKLDEVKFCKNIVSKEEFEKYKGMKRLRPIVLMKWFNGANSAETLQASIFRIHDLCTFLKKSTDKNILLVTHGWYLRLLYIYFKNEELSLKNLLKTKLIFNHGESFQIRLRPDFTPHLSFSKYTSLNQGKASSISNFSIFSSYDHAPESRHNNGNV